MFDDNNDARWPTLVAGLILLIVLAAVAAMSSGLDATAEPAIARHAASTRIRMAGSQRLAPGMHEHAIVRNRV
jgi:ABC-type phosphate transport system substrate-binding protein